MHWSHVQDAMKVTLAELGRADCRPLGERILFRDRCVVGMSFDFEGVSAVWLIALGELKFLDDAGQLLAVVSLLDEDRPKVRRVA